MHAERNTRFLEGVSNSLLPVGSVTLFPLLMVNETCYVQGGHLLESPLTSLDRCEMNHSHRAQITHTQSMADLGRKMPSALSSHGLAHSSQGAAMTFLALSSYFFGAILDSKSFGCNSNPCSLREMKSEWFQVAGCVNMCDKKEGMRICSRQLSWSQVSSS